MTLEVPVKKAIYIRKPERYKSVCMKEEELKAIPKRK